jgi:hypothetical protein
MVCPSCTHRELSASFAASAVKTQAKSLRQYAGNVPHVASPHAINPLLRCLLKHPLPAYWRKPLNNV